MPPRHQAAARGRGREVALPLSPEAVAAQRCAHWVAAAVRAAEDPEQALGALHAARRQVREGRTCRPAAAQLTRLALVLRFRASAHSADGRRGGRRTRARLRGAAQQARRPRARLNAAGAAHGGPLRSNAFSSPAPSSFDRAISALYLYDVCAGESLAHGQARPARSAPRAAPRASRTLCRRLASRRLTHASWARRPRFAQPRRLPAS